MYPEPWTTSAVILSLIKTEADGVCGRVTERYASRMVRLRSKVAVNSQYQVLDALVSNAQLNRSGQESGCFIRKKILSLSSPAIPLPQSPSSFSYPLATMHHLDTRPQNGIYELLPGTRCPLGLCKHFCVYHASTEASCKLVGI